VAFRRYQSYENSRHSIDGIADIGGFTLEQIDALLGKTYPDVRKFDPPYHEPARPELEWGRAGGAVICLHCQLPYYDHPPYPHALFEEHPWLERLCDGKLVKL
jgi:hypothetical protein